MKRLIIILICLIFCQSRGFPLLLATDHAVFTFDVPYIISFLFVLILLSMFSSYVMIILFSVFIIFSRIYSGCACLLCYLYFTFLTNKRNSKQIA